MQKNDSLTIFTRVVRRNRVFRKAVQWTALCVALNAAAAWGQSFVEPAEAPTRPDSNVVSFSPDAIQIQDEAESAIQKGKELEAQGRWLEAKSLYEDAFRAHPDDEKLELRLTLAHIHVDLDRRYADRSFVRWLDNASESRVIEMLSEINLKVQMHYVDDPDWQKFAWRGTANLDIALTKAEAKRRYFPDATNEQINNFRHLLRDDVNKRPVHSRRDAQDLALYAGRLAARELNMNSAVAIMEYCCGAVAALDKYSTYLTDGQLDDVYNQIEGSFVGLGVELKAEDDHLRIVKVFPGGPAATAGIQAGDSIVAVDGQSTKSISNEKAAEMLKGKIHSIVRVSIMDRDKQLRELSIRRDQVDVACVEDVKIIDEQEGVGYFRLTSFQKTTSRDVDAALWQLHRQGMRSLIVDVRSNPGGLLTASVDVADKFLADGRIVSTRGRSSREDLDYHAHHAGTWRIPLVVLIDRDTASASEIFAGAIHDNGRGTVIGERSYGKGSVQGIFPLAVSQSGLRLTTAKFYSPSGQAISNQGVTPDKTVTLAARPDYDSGKFLKMDDPVVKAALDTARQLTVANR